MSKPHLEHRTEDTFDGWLTPEWLLDLVRKMGPIYLDPCTEESNPTKALIWYTVGGLECDWYANSGYQTTWVNPPYGRALKAWADKALEEAAKPYAEDIFVLTPARTETNWFGSLMDKADAVAFFRKRIKFHHPSQPGKQSPKFPNSLFYFGDRRELFCEIFTSVARVVML